MADGMQAGFEAARDARRKAYLDEVADEGIREKDALEAYRQSYEEAAERSRKRREELEAQLAGRLAAYLRAVQDAGASAQAMARQCRQAVELAGEARNVATQVGRNGLALSEQSVLLRLSRYLSGDLGALTDGPPVRFGGIRLASPPPKMPRVSAVWEGAERLVLKGLKEEIGGGNA